MSESIVESGRTFQDDSQEDLLDKTKFRIINTLKQLKLLVGRVFEGPVEVEISKIYGTHKFKDQNIKPEIEDIYTKVVHLESILKGGENIVNPKGAKEDVSKKSSEMAIHLKCYACSCDVETDLHRLKRQVSMCKGGSIIHVDGMCQQSVIRATACSDANNLYNWISATQTIKTEGIRVSPDIHWTGFSSKMTILSTGISNKPRIFLKGVIINPEITSNGSEITLNIFIEGIIYKPNVVVSGINSKVNLIVRGICINPCIQYKGINNSCKVKVRGALINKTYD